MSRRRPAHRWTLVCVAMLSFGLAVERSAAGHREHEERDVWFVHATDPHLFGKAIQANGKTDAKIKEEQAKNGRQEELNKKALMDMLKHVRSLPGGEGPSAFLVLTGDLGIDPCEICKTATKKNVRTLAECLDADPTDQIEKTAEILGDSPVRDIYLVAGNNDIANESASDQALEYFNKFIDAVQAKLDPDKVKLHNLTRGYLSSEAPATCYADIPHTNYRLIGFPSYSFKTKTKDNPAQERQMKIFRRLLDEAKDKRVLIISHTPGMQDPYDLAKARYVDPTPAPGSSPAATEKAEPVATPTASASTSPATVTQAETPTPEEKAATATPANRKKKETETTKQKIEDQETDEEAESKSSEPSASTWKVDEKVLNSWKEAVSSESVIGVFAGHLHDSHKEIYERPYAWSNGSEHRSAFRKLFLAPPLAVKNQEKSPIQARGFSLVHLNADQVSSRLFWYDSETGDFTPPPKTTHHHHHHDVKRGFWEPLCKRFHATIKWLWELGDDHNSKALDRMAMLLIALLATFLTIVAIWQIPPTNNPLTGEPGTPKPAVEPSPFSGHFAGIIIAGLGGLAATTVLKSFEGKPSAGDKEFYIVWFVISFFVLLILSAFLRGLVEALRARFAIIYYPLRRPTESDRRAQAGDQGEPPSKQEPQSGTAPNERQGEQSKQEVLTRPKKKYWRWPGRLWRWLIFRYHALLHWLSSLRVPFLTFADTFTNLIQGKNYTITQAFADKIIDQQRSVLRVANAIRKQLHGVIMEELLESSCKNKKDEKGDETEKNNCKNERKVRPDDVRVNISVLSLDQTNVFYISRAPGSSSQPFLKRSVAWLSVFTGKIRWYKQKYSDKAGEIILFDNSDKTVEDDHPQIYLKSYYQTRAGADYEAFVVFPVPWPQRGLGSDYVKGAIQISFRKEEIFNRLWPFACTPNEVKEKVTKQVDDKIQAAKEADRPGLQGTRNADIAAAAAVATTAGLPCDPVIDQLKYQSEERMLQDWCTSPEVSATLNTSIKVLGEVLRGFNEHIYNNIAKSEQAD